MEGHDDRGERVADDHAPELSEAAWLRAALAAVRPDASVTRVEPIEAGGRRLIVAVRFSDAVPVVVRREPDCAALETESTLLSAVAAETTVPVAEPLGWGPIYPERTGGAGARGTAHTDIESAARTDAGEDGGDGGSAVADGGWLATQLIDGRDLHERFVAIGSTARHELARSFGRYLGELHDVFRFDGYGPIVTGEDRLQAAHSAEAEATAWRDWLRERGHASLDRLPAEFDGAVEPARDRLDAWTVDTAPSPRLFPWDFRPGNALVSEGAITAVVDWEGPLAAGPALSVAKAEYLLADWYVPAEAGALRRAFRDGYAEVRSVPTVENVHRIVAIAEAAVDSRGRVTNPRYPPVDRAAAVAFHRRHLDGVT